MYVWVLKCTFDFRARSARVRLFKRAPRRAVVMNQSFWPEASQGELTQAQLRLAVIAGIEQALGVNNRISTSGITFYEGYGRAGQLISINGREAVQIFPATEAHPTGMYVIDGQSFRPTTYGPDVARQVAATLIEAERNAPRFASRARRTDASSSFMDAVVDSQSMYHDAFEVAHAAIREFAQRTHHTDRPTAAQTRQSALTLAHTLQEIARVQQAL